MKKLKLLHIALGNHNTGLWSSFDKVFDTTHFNWLPYKDSVEAVNSKILEQYAKVKPDVVFMQIQKAGVIKLDTARKMTQNSYTINWTGDVRHPLPEWFPQLGKEISLSLFSNMNDVRVMKEMGLNADFLQVGFDPEIFHPFGQTVKSPKIVFMGSNYKNSMSFPLSQLRYEIVLALRGQFGTNFSVYGSGWNDIIPEATYLDLEQESQVYRSCDIAISLSHFDYGRYSSDRIYRLMGSGAFCLSHQYKEIEKDFVINKHLCTWSNTQELIEKVNYYMSNVYERELIRMEGCKFVREECNWDRRILELKDLIS